MLNRNRDQHQTGQEDGSNAHAVILEISRHDDNDNAHYTEKDDDNIIIMNQCS